MKATEQLRAEHEGIGVMLRVVDQVCAKLESEGSFNDEQFEKIIEFLKVFVDRCHHGKEEDLLFPAMEKAGVPRNGGPIDQMLFEHQQGRRHVSAMDDALKQYRTGSAGAGSEISAQARSYKALMTQHIDKENSVLFPMADSLLSEEIQETLFVKFEELEEKRIGKGVHERFHTLLDELGKIYL